MSTYVELQTAVARELGDDDNDTFTAARVQDFIQDGLAELGRIAPERFQEDITPVADTLEYTLRSDVFDGLAVPEIELTKVELWDGSVTPNEPIKLLQPLDGEYTRLSDAGWKVWGGVLQLPWITVTNTIAGHEDDYLIRVWGYSPYAPVAEDDDVIPVSTELERALIAYCKLQAYSALIDSRMLFTQWQTRSNNSDISPAAMMNEYNLAAEAWRRKARSIMVLRENPG